MRQSAIAAAAWLALAAGVAAARGPSLEVGEVPKGWAAIPAPQDAAQWQCAIDALRPWQVLADGDGRVRIAAPQARQDPPPLRVALADGTLTAAGDGRIEWTPRAASGPAAGFVLSNADLRPRAATEFDGDVFLAEGRSRDGRHPAAILRFERRDAQRWRLHRALDLDATPAAAVRSGERDWVVLTETGLIRVDLAAQRQRPLHRNPGWARLRPQSLQASGAGWLIGTAHGVVRLQPFGEHFSEQWLVPENCRRLAAPQCGCRPQRLSR